MRVLTLSLLLLLALVACRHTPVPEPEPEPEPQATPVTASFTASATIGTAPLEVTFDAGASTGDELDYSWDFGDGSDSTTGQEVTHTYMTAGNFNATLTVTDHHGTSAEHATPISVNVPSNASFTAMPAVGHVPLKVTFDASASVGQDLSYAWQFGESDDGATGPEVTYTFATAGDHTVTLTTTDLHGETASFNLTIRALPVVAAAFNLSSRSGYAPHQVTVDAIHSTGDDLTYTWDFGDGTTSTGSGASHEYAAAGTYTIKLTATDSTGATDVATSTVRVAQPVGPAFTVEPLLAYPQTPITFDAGPSTGEGLIYSWRTSDGAVLSGQTVTHSFASPGDHEVTLTISDARGSTLRASRNVVSVTPAAAGISASSRIATVGRLPVTFEADPGAGFSYEWSYEGITTTGDSATHTFATLGVQEVELVVTDLLGGTDISTFQVTVGEPIEQISVGENNSFLVLADGTLHSWGRGVYGANGNGSQANSDVPGRVQFPIDVSIVQVAAGYVHTLALDSDGRVWAWGDDENQGKLGLGAQITGTELSPMSVTFPQQQLGTARITMLAANYTNSFALDDQDRLWGWGANDYGQLGLGHSQAVREPELLPIQDVTWLAAGREHTLVITGAGELWGWGSNAMRQLALPGGTTITETPTLITNTVFEQVAAGEFFSVALDSQGYLWQWGAVDADIPYADSTDPRIITAPTRLSAAGPGHTHLALFFRNAAAVRADGSAVMWGAGDHGALGHGTEEHRTEPTSVQMPAGIEFTKIDVGMSRSLALDQYGMAWSWGGYDHLGVDGSVGSSSVPVRVHYPAMP